MSSHIHSTARLAIVAASLGLSVGCWRMHSSENASGDVCSSATVYFTNESIDEAAVYVVSPGQRTRIGTVIAGRTDTLTIPLTQLSGGNVSIIARPLAGSRVASSGPISIHTCDQLSVHLPSVENTLVVLPVRP